MPKRCWSCGKDKPLEDFYKNKSSKDGYAHECKDCAKFRVKEYYIKHTGERISYAHEYQKNNREKIKCRKQEYWQRNKENLKKKKALYFLVQTWTARLSVYALF